MRQSELKPEYYEEIPRELQEGILYISKEYSTAIHLCACGCGGKTVTPLGPSRWTLTESGPGRVTLRPSIGNWAGQSPYHAHYFITDNRIEFV